MAVDTRFSINEDLRNAYEISVERSSQTVWLRVPGQNDLVFARNLYDEAKLSRAANSMTAESYARKLARFYNDAGVPTTVTLN